MMELVEGSELGGGKEGFCEGGEEIKGAVAEGCLLGEHG